MRVQKTFKKPSRAKQQFKDECDINRIMAKFRAQGILDHSNRYQGRYEELPTEIDFHADLNAVMAAREAFESLPAKIRSRFHNDPAAFLGFVQNPENQDAINELGLGKEPWEGAASTSPKSGPQSPEPPELPLSDAPKPSEPPKTA